MLLGILEREKMMMTTNRNRPSIHDHHAPTFPYIPLNSSSTARTATKSNAHDALRKR